MMTNFDTQLRHQSVLGHKFLPARFPRKQLEGKSSLPNSTTLRAKNMCSVKVSVPGPPSAPLRQHSGADANQKVVLPSPKETSGSTSKSLKKADPHHSGGPPLSFLSLVWLSLCTALVHRQNELIVVFFAFVTSFALASILSLVRAGRLVSAEKTRSANSTTKNLVGLLSCVASLLTLCWNNDQVSFRFVSIGGTITPEFASLCILTGYLAFDLWFASFCHPPPSARLFSVWEDALTLTAFLVVLVKEWGMDGGCRFRIGSWVAYKSVRLVLDLSRWGHSAATHNDVERTESRQPLSTHVEEMMLKKQQQNTLSTMAEGIAKENTWTVHGQQYDLSDFVARHPGGKEAIELGRGRDCTALFESYHPFTDQHRAVLHKYHVRPAADSDANANTDKFYETLKTRAAETLKEHGIDPNIDRASTLPRAAYYVFIFCCLLIAARYHIRGNVFGSFLFAVFGWLIGALGHDGGHFAVSRKPFVNDLSVWGISFLCNPVMWQHQHTYAHHSHTNEFDHDPDLHHFTAFLRVHRKFRHEERYGLQRNRAFVFFAYAFVVFGTCIKIPFGMLKDGSLYGIVEFTDRKRPLRAFMMLAHYVGYIGIILVAPIFFSGQPWYLAILAGLTHVVTAGMLFAIFSQINHLNERSIEIGGVSDRPSGSKDPSNLVETSWAARQVVTSNNFATSSFAWHLLSNGLNLQIEHHLFPGLNHCHLHLIAPVVRQTCEEYGVLYKSYETWSDLMDATLQWLDALSLP